MARQFGIENIKYIQFGTFTAEEWQKFAVCTITTPSPQGGSEKHRDGTPYDPRMGCLENSRPCATCQGNNISCPGHFGIIDLPIPVYNYMYMDVILKILQSVCIVCARTRIKLNRSNIDLQFPRSVGLKRLRIFSKKCDPIVQCQWEDCSQAIPSFDLNKITKLNKVELRQWVGDKSKAIPFKAGEARDVFLRITNETLFLLGFNQQLGHNDLFTQEDLLEENKIHVHQFRPESLIFFPFFPVLPPIARPFVKRDGLNCDDDLTEKYNSILKVSARIRESNEIRIPGMNQRNKRRGVKVSEATKQKDEEELQNHIWTLMDNKDEKSKLSSGGRPHKSIIQRLSGKEGRVQANIAGKRVDFSARSVIVGGGIMLKNDELGVPRSIAMELTTPHLVKEWNIQYLQTLVNEGKVNRVRNLGKRKCIRSDELYKKGMECELEINDIVDRQLKNGDIILFNRQPTLRKESMTSFRVKIIEGYAFRLGLCWTKGFNADFDGDEMNAHIPQSKQARVEAEILMRSAVHIVSGQGSAPINGIVQDGLIGAYLLTNTWAGDQPDTMVSVKTVETCIIGAEISQLRFNDLLDRAWEYYPTYIKKSKTGEYSLKTKEIPGKLFFSILFPADFCYTNSFDEDNKTVVKDGVLTPNSAPISNKTIGAKGNSIIHILWKEYSPEAALYFLSETQQLIDRWLPSHGFSMGISDFMSDSNENITRIISELKAEVNSILDKSGGGIPNDREENSISRKLINAFDSKKNVDLIKTSMPKGDRNSLKIMINSGAKGKIANLMQIMAFVGQQSLNTGSARLPMTLSGGTRSLPYFEKNDYAPEARGFVENGYLKGLTPQEVFFHAAGGRVGIISTAIKTAETGYIQKRIGRKLEDFKVEIDGSVRDANNRVIQFLYGDDGMDAKKLYMPKDDNINFPVFINLINLSKRLNSNAKRQAEIEDGEVPRSLSSDEIDMLMNFIHAGPPGLKTDIIENATKNTRNILRVLLKNKKVLLYESVIPSFFAEIKNTYEKSKAQQGDMVGLDAASFVGEPTTQFSARHDTRVFIRENKGKRSTIDVKYGTIGEIIDEFLEIYRDEIVYIGNDSVLWHPSHDIYIMTVNTDNEKTEWKKLSEVSRHPTNGDLVNVKTKSNREVTTTIAHSHLSRTKLGTIVPKKAGELSKGDFIPVSKKMNSDILYKNILIKRPSVEEAEDNFDLDFDNGWIIGTYLVNNCCSSSSGISKTHLTLSISISEKIKERLLFFTDRYKAKVVFTEHDEEYIEYTISFIPHIVSFILKHCGESDKKKIPGFALFSPLEFAAGILRGYFDNFNNKLSLEAKSKNKNLIEQVALLLSRFGIFGVFGVEESVNSYSILQKHYSLFTKNIGSDIYDISSNGDFNDEFDRIPFLEEEIERLSIPLKMYEYVPEERTTAIDREKLSNYRDIFEQKAAEKGWDLDLSLINQSIDSDIIWDEITEIEVIPDPREMVYDFGVEGNHTFMIQNGIFTHNTLNVFHLAGIGGVEENLGIKRFEEILNSTKSEKQKFITATVRLNEPFLNENSETVNRLERKQLEVVQNSPEWNIMEELIKHSRISSLKFLESLKKNFEETTVNTFFLDYEMQYIRVDVDPDIGASPPGIITYKEYTKRWWVILSEKLRGPPEFEPEHWVLIIKLDTEEMFRRDIELSTICEAIEEQSEGKYSCVASPNVLGLIEIYCNWNLIKEYAMVKLDIPNEDEERIELITPDNVNYFTCRKAVLKYIKNEVKISGILGVKSALPVEDNKTKLWYFHCECRGVVARPTKKRFLDILTEDYVNPYTTLTNDVHAIYDVLGIEAARKFLAIEVNKIIAKDGFINPRHIQLLIDGMCHTGEITSVRRDGIPRDVGPIAKIMFEQPVDNAIQAAIFGEPDMMRSVSSSIMYGTVARAGTGVVKVDKPDRMASKPVRPSPSAAPDSSDDDSGTESGTESGSQSDIDSDYEDEEEKDEDEEEKDEDEDEQRDNDDDEKDNDKE
jgi:DNA-directed RNA polymerase beta' subunit/intein/homing endonuclease